MNKVVDKWGNWIDNAQDAATDCVITNYDGAQVACEKIGQVLCCITELAAEIKSQEEALESRDETIKHLSDDLAAAHERAASEEVVMRNLNETMRGLADDLRRIVDPYMTDSEKATYSGRGDDFECIRVHVHEAASDAALGKAVRERVRYHPVDYRRSSGFPDKDGIVLISDGDERHIGMYQFSPGTYEDPGDQHSLFDWAGDVIEHADAWCPVLRPEDVAALAALHESEADNG